MSQHRSADSVPLRSQAALKRADGVDATSNPYRAVVSMETLPVRGAPRESDLVSLHSSGDEEADLLSVLNVLYYRHVFSLFAVYELDVVDGR